MKIVTLTLNPAFDVHCLARDFKPYHESVAEITSVEAGGKGVNISRALASNGVENRAIVVVGTENGEEFCKTLKRDSITVVPVWTHGRIRENITLHEEINPETRISFNGFSCEKSVLDEVREKLGTVDNNTIIAFTGSIPVGIKSEDVLLLLSTLKDRGVKIVIDSRSVSLNALLGFKPWLIKPNKDEAEQYTGKKIETVEDAVRIAKEIFDCGVENVIVSLGETGAVLACSPGIYYAKTPKIDAVSTIGAGDSTIAGFIDGTVRGQNIEDILKQAVAYGTAACMREGTKPPLACDIEKIEKQIEIIKF